MNSEFFFLNRIEVPWAELDSQLAHFNCEVAPTKMDGFCFLSALQQCLIRDHCIHIPLDFIKRVVDSEIYEHCYVYRPSYAQSMKAMFAATNDYLVNGNWAQNIVDVAVCAAANGLSLNMCIFKNVDNRALLYFLSSNPPSTRDIFMRYDHDHYDSIVWKGGHTSEEIYDKTMQYFRTQNDYFTEQLNITQTDIDEIVARETREYFQKEGVYIKKHFRIRDGIDDPIDDETRAQLEKKGVYFTHHLKQKLHPTNSVNAKPECEDIGSDMEEDFTYNDSEDSSAKADPKKCDEKLESPFKIPFTEEDFEDPQKYGPIPDNQQFEEDYSGCEDAVLDRKKFSDSDTDTDPTGDVNKENTTVSPQPEKEDLRPYASPVNLSDANSDSMSSSVFSDASSTTSSVRRSRPKYYKSKMDEERMAKCPIEKVDAIPWDIDGDHIYQMPIARDTFCEMYVDGRHFHLKHGSRKGLNGIRKVGPCKGSMICLYEDCTKLKSEGVINISDFQRLAKGLFTCKSCGFLARRIACEALKAVEYDNDTGLMTYKHQGKHSCRVKTNVHKRRIAVEKLPLPISGATRPKKFMEDCFRYHFENRNIDEAFEICDDVSLADVKEKIRKMRNYKNKSVNKQDLFDAFGHIAHIQASLRKANRDKYLIYRWQCKDLNGEDTYVFKTSQMSIELALKMGGKIKIGREDSNLREEPAYFDGMHERIKNFMTLTLWVFHPGMRSMQILAAMDCPREDTHHITLFFRLFNDAMREYLNDPGYLWDPCLIMMDEKGANFVAISNVFGENFRKKKAKSCQYHFKNCAEKYLSEVPIQTRQYFRRLCNKLCEAHTRGRYMNVKDKIIKICELYGFMTWWKFWAPRSPHIVPALRGFGLPRMNLAEAGQSTMRGGRKMWLSEATFKDIAALAFQASNHKNFIESREALYGKGPTLLKTSGREKANENRFIEQVDEVLFRGSLEEEGEKQIQEPIAPSVRAKHKAPRIPLSKRNINQKEKDDEVVLSDSDDEERYSTKTGKRSGTKTDSRKNPKRRGRGKNKRYSQNPVRLTSGSDEDTDDVRLMVPEELEKEIMKPNRVYYVIPSPNNRISRCQGCGYEITKGEKAAPKNLLFLYKMKRPVPPQGNKGGQWVLSRDKRNCYFHASDLGCLWEVHELVNIQLSDIYMSNKDMKDLTKENIAELEKRSHWDAMLENRENLIRTGRLGKRWMPS